MYKYRCVEEEVCASTGVYNKYRCVQVQVCAITGVGK